MSVVPTTANPSSHGAVRMAGALEHDAAWRQRRSLHRYGTLRSSSTTSSGARFGRWRRGSMRFRSRATTRFTTSAISRCCSCRVEQTTVKAYHNVCPHRGTALGEGSRHVRRRTHHLSVPWLALGPMRQKPVRARATGVSRRPVARQRRRIEERSCRRVRRFRVHQFRAKTATLRRVHRADPPLDRGSRDRRHASLLVEVDRVPANWKVAQEAFFEAYHVSATHPQLEKVGREIVYGNRAESTRR